VVELARKVEIRYPDEFAGIFPRATPARVSMLVGKRALVATVPRPLGDASNPMQQSAVEEKLHDLGRDILSKAEMERLIRSTTLLKQGNAAPLLACLAAGIDLPGGNFSNSSSA